MQGHHDLEAGDDEDLPGHHHECQHTEKQDLLTRKLQPVKGVGTDGHDQDLTDDHHNRHQNGVQIQSGEIQFIGDNGIVHPLGYLRKKLHRNLYGFFKCLNGGKEHPDKGPYRQEGAHNQENMVHNPGKEAFFVFQLHSHSIPRFHPVFFHNHLYNGDYHDDKSQHNGDCRAVTAHAALIKGALVEIGHKAHAVSIGIGGPVHHQINEVKNLEDADGYHNHGEENHGTQQRQGYFEEQLPVGGAIDFRRLIVGLVDALHGCQHNNGVVAYHGPYQHQNDGPADVVDVSQPGNPLQTNLLQEEVQNAVLVVENPAPQNTDGGGHCNRGNIQQRAVQRPSADLLVHKVRKKDGEEKQKTFTPQISGLKGIEAKRGKYIRPLIEVPREEIENYCEKNKLNPRIDKSNQENIYTRNKVRNVVIPYIKREFNPNIIKTINRLSEVATEENEYLEKITEKTFNEICICPEKQIILDIKKFNKLELVIKRRVILYTINEVLGSTAGIEKINIDDIIKLCNNNIGNKYLMPTKNIQILIKKGKIFFNAKC